MGTQAMGVISESRPERADARLELVDVLRGFALMGLFLVHMLESFELYWADVQPSPVVDTVFLLFMGKSFSLLALCFGFSFFILMDRAARRGVDFTGRFAWRLLILALIGWGHAIVYRGDIIQLLAGMGLLLLIAHRVRNNRALIAVAVLCLLNVPQIVRVIAAAQGAEWANAAPHFWTDPSMPTYLTGSLSEVIAANLGDGQVPKWWFFIESGRLLQILGLYLLGMVLGRIGFFAAPQRHARICGVALAVAAIVAVALYFAKDPLASAFQTLGHGAGATRTFAQLLGGYFELAGTMVWLLLIVMLWQTLLQPLLIVLFAPLGRLTLTLYIAQSIVFVPVFYGYGLGLHDDLSPAARLALGLVALALQIGFAHWWLRRFRYGPIEWAWRAATYRTWDVPFRRAGLSESSIHTGQ